MRERKANALIISQKNILIEYRLVSQGQAGSLLSLQYGFYGSLCIKMREGLVRYVFTVGDYGDY